MKKYILLMIIPLLFASCSTKIEQSLAQSKEQNVSDLIDQLAKKERELNELSRKLDKCESDKKLDK